MQTKKSSILGYILIALIGAVYIFSAITKLMPIGDFEYIIQSQLPFDKISAKIVARLFIGLELAIGLLLVLNILGKKLWVFSTAIILLVLFSIHLIILYINQGNDVNCGCMGSMIPMKPIPSVLKNAGMIIVLLAGLYFWKKGKPTGWFAKHNLLALIFVCMTIGGVFIAFPLSAKDATLSISKMYEEEQTEKPKQDLKKGKRILCLMTLGCSHCRDAAKSIQAIVTDNNQLPFYFLFPYPQDTTSVEEQLFDFLDDTKTYNVPFHFVKFETFADYVTTSGNTGTPVILMMEDSTIVKEIPMSAINAKEIEQWLKK